MSWFMYDLSGWVQNNFKKSTSLLTIYIYSKIYIVSESSDKLSPLERSDDRVSAMSGARNQAVNSMFAY